MSETIYELEGDRIAAESTDPEELRTELNRIREHLIRVTELAGRVIHLHRSGGLLPYRAGMRDEPMVEDLDRAVRAAWEEEA